MRSTFAGLNTMVRGIMANQMSLDTTGHNITNAGTEGYSRQSVNLATTYSEERGSLYGTVRVGTGVDAMSVQRARNVYADIQYRNENPTQQYYKTLSVNYDKLETVFDDSKSLGIEAAIGKFYQAWVDLSTTASTSSSRTNVIEQGRNLSDLLQSTTSELQEQIRSQYEDIKSEVDQVDQILQDILDINKQVVAQEVSGASANDLRDRRDLLVDQLSSYMNINITELSGGAYQINSGGVTLVNGMSRTHLVMSEGTSSHLFGVDYGITDFNIKIAESDIVFMPQDGILKSRFDAIAENKSYIDKMADIANFLLTAFNDQHKQGWDIDGHYKFVDGDGNEVDESNVIDNGDGTYSDGRGNAVSKVPDTVNFYGTGSVDYQYRYDPEFKRNYLYKNDPNLPESDRLLSGVKIIAELEINSVFNQNRGDRYVAAATSKQFVETSPGNGTWENMAWNDRTGDGTNAVYLSELFNINLDTIISDGKANADVVKANCILRDWKTGKYIDEEGNILPDQTDSSKYVYATATAKFSINSYYQKSVSTLGIDAHTVDTNYEAMQAIMTQVTNWRDSTSGVDWNEELTNMIKFQKGFASCSRCLSAMDEMLDRLVNSTGVVGR